MKILVTGARGMLGSDLCPVFRERHDVLATDIEDMDVRDRTLIKKTLNDYLPDFVIHLAALTDVDECERKPDDAFLTNSIGTQYLTLACNEIRATLVYVSTLGVFDGQKPTPYTEFDTPNPINVYGQSKLDGERIARTFLYHHYIVRTGWLFGGGTEDKKFVAKILDLAKTHTEIKAVDDKFGSPTYTVDLARGILSLIETRLFGLYHMVNTGCASRHEVACEIVKYAEIKNCHVVPVSSAEFPLAAERSRMEASRNCRLDLMGLDLMRDWHSALHEYLDRLKE
jgi:dTDP-4-dehydrorhamnose reductase